MGSEDCKEPISPAMLADRSPPLATRCPRPSILEGGPSRWIRFADRGPDVLLPTPLLVAEFGFLPPDGSLPADIEGEGEDVEELMPFVWMPGGIGRLILEECDWVEVAEGAMSIPPLYKVE